MAKLEIVLDTESRDMKVTVNGEAVDNVGSVSVYQYADRDDDDNKVWQPRFSVETWSHEDGLNRRVCLTASDRGAPDRGVVTASRFAGVFEVRDEDAIASYLEKLLLR